MDKLKAAEKLKEKGYDASGSEGIVIVKYASGTYEETKKDVGALLKDMKYDASWGLVCNRKTRAADVTEAGLDQDVNAEEYTEAPLETILPEEGEQLSFA